METASEVGALRVPFDKIGIVKEAPVVRWLSGLQMYDKKYYRKAKKAMKTRQHNDRKAQILTEKAQKAGIIQGDNRRVWNAVDDDELSRPNDVLDLSGEHPPPSAICGRRDTVSA